MRISNLAAATSHLTHLFHTNEPYTFTDFTSAFVLASPLWHAPNDGLVRLLLRLRLLLRIIVLPVNIHPFVRGRWPAFDMRPLCLIGSQDLVGTGHSLEEQAGGLDITRTTASSARSGRRVELAVSIRREWVA